MKSVRDVPAKIVIEASSQRTSESQGPVRRDQIRITQRSSREVLDSIPHTLYTSRGKR